jgi:hypothetical protein
MHSPLRLKVKYRNTHDGRYRAILRFENNDQVVFTTEGVLSFMPRRMNINEFNRWAIYEEQSDGAQVMRETD